VISTAIKEGPFADHHGTSWKTEFRLFFVLWFSAIGRPFGARTNEKEGKKITEQLMIPEPNF